MDLGQVESWGGEISVMQILIMKRDKSPINELDHRVQWEMEVLRKRGVLWVLEEVKCLPVAG